VTEALARRAKTKRPRMLFVMTTSGSTQRETAQKAWQRFWQLYQQLSWQLDWQPGWLPGWQPGSQLDGNSIGRMTKSPRPKCH